MACTKHIHRKRYNTCPDCAAELEKKGATTEKTSREMLAEISSMEKEADELVIKKERKKKIKEEPKIETPVTISKEQSELEVQFAIIDNYFSAKKIEVDKYFDEKLKEFKSKVSAISTPRYENLYVPLDQFSIKIMDKLYTEKWRLINFWDSNIAKASGIKRDVAVLERMVSPDNKPKPEYKL